MPQMNLYVSKDIAKEVKRRAAGKGVSTSRYLADLGVDARVFGQKPVTGIVTLSGQTLIELSEGLEARVSLVPLRARPLRALPRPVSESTGFVHWAGRGTRRPGW